MIKKIIFLLLSATFGFKSLRAAAEYLPQSVRKNSSTLRYTAAVFVPAGGDGPVLRAPKPVRDLTASLRRLLIADTKEPVIVESDTKRARRPVYVRDQKPEIEPKNPYDNKHYQEKYNLKGLLNVFVEDVSTRFMEKNTCLDRVIKKDGKHRKLLLLTLAQLHLCLFIFMQMDAIPESTLRDLTQHIVKMSQLVLELESVSSEKKVSFASAALASMYRYLHFSRAYEKESNYINLAIFNHEQIARLLEQYIFMPFKGPSDGVIEASEKFKTIDSLSDAFGNLKIDGLALGLPAERIGSMGRVAKSAWYKASRRIRSCIAFVDRSGLDKVHTTNFIKDTRMVITMAIRFLSRLGQDGLTRLGDATLAEYVEKLGAKIDWFVFVDPYLVH